MNSLEEIALKVANEIPGFVWCEGSMYEDGVLEHQVKEFAIRLVAALGAQQVPIAEVASGVWGDRLMWACSDSQGSVPVGTKLFAAPVLPSVPEGWQMVPKILTKEMQEDGYFDNQSANQILWDQLLDAAPSPQEDAP